MLGPIELMFARRQRFWSVRVGSLAAGLVRSFSNLRPGIRVAADDISWPSDPAALVEQWTGNNDYRDFRAKTWLSAWRALKIESLMFERMQGGTHHEHDLGVRMAELEWVLGGLDFGVASTVYAISAAGGIPITSCNGGAFGDHHNEPFPLVGFYWHPRLWPYLRKAAEQARVSVWTHHRGELVVAGKNLRRMPSFAAAIIRRKVAIERGWEKIRSSGG